MSENIEDILEQLDDMLDAAWAMPLSGGKVVLNGDRVRDLLDDIRASLPSEIRQAKAIVQDRTEIVNNAKKEAEGIIRNAEERRNQILSHEEIVVQAQEKANEIHVQTQKRAREMRRNAQEFTEDILRRTEEALTQQVSQVRQARISLRSNNKQTESAE